MSDLIIFGFRGTITESILRSLPLAHKRVVESSVSAIDALIDESMEAAPKYIIGMGQYTGRDRDRLRVETVCTNKFRNSIEGNAFEVLEISEFLVPSLRSKFARGMGNSWCNRVSYCIAKRILDQNLPTQYAFIHIPASFNAILAAEEIHMMIDHVDG